MVGGGGGSREPLTGNIIEDRASIRDDMENLNIPVQGLIKNYQKPFSVFDGSNPDAHEALGIDDLVMAYYGEDNQILLDRK